MSNPFSDIRLIVFDLDGTLVNSQFDLLDAVNYALGKLDKNPIEQEQIAGMLGGGIRQLISLALGQNAEPAFSKAFQLFKQHYSKHFANKTKPYPGVPETLAALSSYKKAVLSNKAHPFTVQIIRKTGLEKHFELVLGAQPDKYALKPSPEGLRYILQELNISSRQALMVGDSTHDIEAAKALNMKTCAVTYGYRPADLLKRAKPDVLIKQMQDLRELLLHSK